MSCDTDYKDYEKEYVRSEAAPEIDFNKPTSDATPEIPEEMPENH